MLVGCQKIRVLHINVNYIVSALHQTMIDHLNTIDGIENSVFVPTYDKSRSIVDCKEYVTLTECFQKLDRFFYYKKQNKIINAILNSYDVSSFDIIHAYTLFTDGNVAMKLSKKYGIPYVVAIRNTDVNVFFKKMIHLRKLGVEILENASAIFFLSPIYRDVVITKYVPTKLRDIIRNKSYIIPNGIDDFWHKNNSKKDFSNIEERICHRKEINCIYVGGIDKNKNIELTLKSLTKLNNNGYRCSLTSIGKIVTKSVYEKLCEYPLFLYVKPKKKEELIDYYRKADIFIMPSHTETFGLVYAEAMSQGLPVIYTKGQGFDGHFLNGEVGYSTDDNCEEDLINALLKIVDNYETISLNCSDYSNKFDWMVICKKYIDIYRTILLEVSK